MLRPGLSPLGLALAFVALGWLCATAGLWTPIEWAAEAAHLPAASGLPVGLPLGLALSWVVVSRWRALPGVPLGVLGLHLLMRGGATGPLIGQEVLFVTALAASTATGLVAVAAAALKALHLDRSPLADLRSAGTLLGLLTAFVALQAAASILGLGWLEPWTEPERYDGAWHAFAGTFSGLMVVLPGVLIARSDTVTGHRAHWVAATSLAVVLLGRALSANHHGSDAALAQSEFIAHSESAARALGRELEVTETLLLGLAGHIEATPEVHAEGFRTMSQQLQLQANAVHAVSWNPVVSQAQRTAFERADTHGPAPAHPGARLVGPPGAGGRAATVRRGAVDRAPGQQPHGAGLRHRVGPGPPQGPGVGRAQRPDHRHRADPAGAGVRPELGTAGAAGRGRAPRGRRQARGGALHARLRHAGAAHRGPGPGRPGRPPGRWPSGGPRPGTDPLPVGGRHRPHRPGPAV